MLSVQGCCGVTVVLPFPGALSEDGNHAGALPTKHAKLNSMCHVGWSHCSQLFGLEPSH